MKYIACNILIGAILAGGIPVTQAAPLPFPDMGHSWYGYRDAVNDLRERGIIRGNPDGTFRPNAPVNRAELLKMVLAASGRRSQSPGGCFTDVPAEVWFTPFVCTAASDGIVNGYPDGTFHPERSVNFAEAVKIVLRAFGSTVAEHGGEHWYEPYVNVIDRREILPSHSFLPDAVVTRERAADLIHRMLLEREGNITLRRSPGCGTESIFPPVSVDVGGRERTFLLTTPRGYDASQPSPLIVAFHGRTSDNAEVKQYFGLEGKADEFFIAYPAALERDTGTFHWSDPGDTNGTLRDYAFFDTLVETLAGKYCIDMDRIFVVGHSLGGWFANSLACERGDVIRASATVGGDMAFTDCKGPAAALIAHNPLDNLAAFSGSEHVRTHRVEENACSWDTMPWAPTTLRCEEHQACGENPILWCPHNFSADWKGNYYPHVWPTTMADEILRFFRSLK